MADVIKNLCNVTMSTTTIANYTASTVTTIITEMIISNNSSSSVTASILFTDKFIVPNKQLAAREMYRIPLSAVLNSGGTIKTICSDLNTNIYVSGIEVS